MVLSFLIFKAMRILVLKLSKFRKPKALRLMTLMRLLVASSFGQFQCVQDLVLVFHKGLKNSLKDRIYTRNCFFNESKEMFSLFLLKMKKVKVGRAHNVLVVLESKRAVFPESLDLSNAYEKLGDKNVYR